MSNIPTDSSIDNGSLSGSMERKQPETAKIQQDIAQTRADLGSTLEELHEKLTPAALKEQAMERVQDAKEAIKTELKSKVSDAKETLRDATVGKASDMVRGAQDVASQTSHTLMDMIKQNPIPVTMIGAGLAWMIINARSGSRARMRPYYPSADEYTYRGGSYDEEATYRNDPYGEPRARGMKQKVGSAMQQMGDTATDVSQRVQRKAGEVGSGATDLARRTQASLRDAGHVASERAQRLGNELRTRGRQLNQRAGQVYQDNPLIVGAAVAVAGGLIAMALPVTEREQELMGAARDGLVERAQGAARGALDKVEDAVKRAADKSS